MIRHDFGSIDEMVNAPFTRKDNEERCHQNLGGPGRWVKQNLWGSEREWFGGPQMEMVAKVAEGWPEGADRVLSNMEDLQMPTPISAKRRLVREEFGDELDIHAVYRGDFQHAWTSRKRRPVRGSQLVRLVTQSDINANVTAEHLFWRGAGFVKLADVLAAAGYSVEILGVTSSTHAQGYDLNTAQAVGEGCMFVTYVIKESRSPLDIVSLAGVVCNPSFDRMYAWRMLYQFAPGEVYRSGAAGSDTNHFFIQRANLGADGVPTFVSPYSMLSKQSAQEWASQCIAALDTSDHLVGVTY